MPERPRVALRKASLGSVVALYAGLCAAKAGDPHQSAASSRLARTRPALLLALEAQRARRWATGRVDWTFTGLGSSHSVHHFTSRFAGEDQIITDRGDERGVIGIDQASNEYTGERHYWLRANGEGWQTHGRSTMAHIWSDDAAIRRLFAGDIRAADLDPQLRSSPSVHAALWRCGLENLGGARSSEARDGDLELVSTVYGAGERAVERKLWIDPARDSLVVRAEVWTRQGLAARASATPRKFGDVWFPGEIRYREAGSASPTWIVTVESAECGGRLPNSFRPEDIGIEVGTNLIFDGSATQPGGLRFWDGQNVVSPREFRAQLDAGKIQLGPNFLKAGREGPPRPTMPAEHPILVKLFRDWGREVDGFAAEHRFDERQRQAAKGILADCKATATRYRDSHRDEFETYRAKVQADMLDVRHRLPNDMQEIHAMERELSWPLKEIARRSLRPRLEALLTAVQRAEPAELASRSIGR